MGDTISLPNMGGTMGGTMGATGDSIWDVDLLQRDPSMARPPASDLEDHSKKGYEVRRPLRPPPSALWTPSSISSRPPLRAALDPIT
eukprot:1658077-Pyramimonas_sp.AAC.1